MPPKKKPPKGVPASTPAAGASRILAPSALELAPHRLMLNRAGVTLPPAPALAAPTISDVLDALRAVYRKLVDLTDDDIQQMSEADRTAWAHYCDELFRDIRVLEINELRELNAAFASRLPELSAATVKIDKTLGELEDIVAVIRATTAVLGIVTDIVGLLR